MTPVQIGPARIATVDHTCCYCLKPIDIGDRVCRIDTTNDDGMPRRLWAHEACVDRELW